MKNPFRRFPKLTPEQIAELQAAYFKGVMDLMAIPGEIRKIREQLEALNLNIQIFTRR